MLRISHLAAIVALVLCSVACGSTQSKNADTTETKATDIAAAILTTELTEGCTAEVLVEFGEVEPSSIATRHIRVTNNTSAPVVLLDYETTCRCTTLEFDRTPIEPGKELDMVLKFDSRGEWGSVGNFLEVTTSNPECGLVVWMSAYIE